MTSLNPTNRMQYVSINGTSSDPLKVNFGIPQGSVLGTLLFLSYINDLHNSNRFSSPFHFTDDTDLLNIQGSIRAIKKTLNKDIKELSLRLNANKIALNVAKTQITLFKTSNASYDVDLAGFIDEKLNWKPHINEILVKLISGNVILPKLQHFVNKDILISCLVWGQAKYSLNRKFFRILLHMEIIPVLVFVDKF